MGMSIGAMLRHDFPLRADHTWGQQTCAARRHVLRFGSLAFPRVPCAFRRPVVVTSSQFRSGTEPK
eukprot:15455236-Alexandrium_andersonii.AAC.1